CSSRGSSSDSRPPPVDTEDTTHAWIEDYGGGFCFNLAPFAEAPDGSLWTGGVGGIQKWTRGTRGKYELTRTILDDKGIHVSGMTSVGGTTWAGTNDGKLHRFESEDRKTTFDVDGAPARIAALDADHVAYLHVVDGNYDRLSIFDPAAGARLV